MTTEEELKRAKETFELETRAWELKKAEHLETINSLASVVREHEEAMRIKMKTCNRCSGRKEYHSDNNGRPSTKPCWRCRAQGVLIEECDSNVEYIEGTQDKHPHDFKILETVKDADTGLLKTLHLKCNHCEKTLSQTVKIQKR